MHRHLRKLLPFCKWFFNNFFIFLKHRAFWPGLAGQAHINCVTNSLEEKDYSKPHKGSVGKGLKLYGWNFQTRGGEGGVKKIGKFHPYIYYFFNASLSWPYLNRINYQFLQRIVRSCLHVFSSQSQSGQTSLNQGNRDHQTVSCLVLTNNILVFCPSCALLQADLQRPERNKIIKHWCQQMAWDWSGNPFVTVDRIHLVAVADHC